MREAEFTPLKYYAPEGWRAVLRRDPCSYCGEPGGTIDHVQALRARRRRGGKNRLENLVGACKRCNSWKSNHPLLWWLVQREKVRTLDAPELPPPRKHLWRERWRAWRQQCMNHRSSRC